MALEQFIRLADFMVEFESDFNQKTIPITSVHSVAVHRDELKSTWEKAKGAYEKHILEFEASKVAEQAERSDGDTKVEKETRKVDRKKGDKQLETLKAKYKSTYATYCRCLVFLGELEDKLRSSSASSSSSNSSSLVPRNSSSFKLPSCDAPVFYGDYVTWPTFRDSFVATFMKSDLSSIEKLLHLRQRTKQDAFDIVSKAPLENIGFDMAWEALKARYENKRILVNNQIRKLFDLKPISIETSASLESFQRNVNSCLSNLKLYKIDVSSWDPILVYFATNRLPETTLTLWEHTLKDKTLIPSWKELDCFLTNRYRTLESVAESKGTSLSSNQAKSKPNHNLNQSQKHFKTFQTNVKVPNCPLCANQSHIIRKCPKFNSMVPKSRFDEIKKQKLCINCFSKSHSVANCTSKYTCSKCSKKHHTLLHLETTPAVHLNPNSRPFVSQEVQSTIVQSNFCSNSKGVLLGTAMVELCYLEARYKVRALIDSGSEGSFLSEKLFNRLKLPYFKTNAQISGLNNSISATASKQCSFALSSSCNPDIQIPITALVVPQLSGNLPSSSLPKSVVDSLPLLPWADPQFYSSSNIDILLGGNVFPSIMLSGYKNNVGGSLLAQETIFGWILTGPVSSRLSSNFTTVVSFHCGVSVDEQISKFWVVENLPKKNLLTDTEKYCEDFYSRTTKRTAEGRYIVSLPFKERFPSTLQLGYSRSSALAQFIRNENRLLRNPEFKLEYDQVIKEYIDMGHMTEIPLSVEKVFNSSNYYLPHHAVIKEESTTTKVRVVFNASSRTSNGISLNDVLYAGPALQMDLILLLQKWRFFEFVFNADIQKMYRQILVNDKDVNFQRILFRSNPSDDIKEYNLNTVTFGVNCAPYLAIRTMLQLAEDYKYQYPLASQILKTNMYVDDVLAGFHSVDDANNAKRELLQVLHAAGFSLRKWTSNKKEILSDLPSEHLLHKDFLDFDSSSIAKTLGIRWNALTDSFYFLVQPFPEKLSYTKREVLSDIAKLFDPAGWLAPCVILAKILMQKIWLEHIEWDDNVSPGILSEWKTFQSTFVSLNNISLPRWIGFSPIANVQFHGFCDASERAYAAVVYIRVEIEEKVDVHLLCSKTRVAPIKTLTIPRLELCGALLLAELIDSIIPGLDISKYSLFCWTDSTIVQSWLAKPPSTWNTFVSHRVSTIIEIVDPKYWFHVVSEENPADLASRGIMPNFLSSNNLWWNGPTWLKNRSETWRNDNGKPLDTDLEKKPIKCHTSLITDHDDPLTRFSSLPKALRCLAYVYRFYFRLHPKLKANFSHSSRNISSEEVNFVRNRLIIMYQKVCFPKEYKCLTKKLAVSSSSSILCLNPFLDEEGIVRCCGRLEKSPELTFNDKYPIILPYSCHYVRLLIRFIHEVSLHGGNQLVLRLIRSQYWIPRVKNLIKFTINQCKICLLYKQRCQKQLMSALPKERTTISRPFSHTGTDFAGPFDIKNYTGRACRITKGYVCIFVCFSTKAIHLEATSDLSATTFLSAFQRFISRRGCPTHIYSDNGTNFVGASKILAKEFLLNSKTAIENKYAHQNVRWHFIPPGSPHMGGLWEAGVKSFKSHISKVAGSFKYTFEEFSTLLAQIEACLNSRPLSPQSEDPSDLSALTPGHFLTGGPILAPLESVPTDTAISITNRWQRLKVIHKDFCIRWKNEYLRELQKRTKWQTSQRDLQVNDMVILREENLPPSSWRLGRVVQLHSGDDKRVVDVRTQRGMIRRPIVKLIRLPSDN